MIMELIHAFGAGIAFAAGITCGGIMMQIANRSARKKMCEDYEKHFREVEDRLGKYVVHTARIADALEKGRASEA